MPTNNDSDLLKRIQESSRRRKSELAERRRTNRQSGTDSVRERNFVQDADLRSRREFDDKKSLQTDSRGRTSFREASGRIRSFTPVTQERYDEHKRNRGTNNEFMRELGYSLDIKNKVFDLDSASERKRRHAVNGLNEIPVREREKTLIQGARFLVGGATTVGVEAAVPLDAATRFSIGGTAASVTTYPFSKGIERSNRAINALRNRTRNEAQQADQHDIDSDEEDSKWSSRNILSRSSKPYYGK